MVLIGAYSKYEVHFEEVMNADILLIQRNLLKSYILSKLPGSDDTIKFKDYSQQNEAQIHK